MGQRVTEDGVTPMIRGGFEILDEIAEEAWRDLAERLALERKRNEVASVRYLVRRLGFFVLTDKTDTVLPFGWALGQLWDGRKITRSGWNGVGQYLELQRPDENSKMTLPYIYLTTVQGDRVPWLASQTDLLANDWLLCE